MEVGQEAGDHQDALVDVRLVGEHPGGVEAFQQHGAGRLVVVEQADRPVAGPQAQGDRLALALVVADLELEHRRGAVGAVDREDQGADAVHGRPGEAQLPAVQEPRGEVWEGGDEGPPGLLVELDLCLGEFRGDVDHSSHGSGVRGGRAPVFRASRDRYGSRTTLPVVTRFSRARWASAARDSGKRCTAG